MLALSLTFASCADSTDTDDENPSPALPANVGENPIKEKIRLKRDNYSSYYLELKTDGTACYVYDNEIEMTYKYSYDTENKTITMILEKYYYRGFFIEEKGQLLTYGELCSKIDEDITVENMRQFEKEYYKKHKDDEEFKERYSDCNSYEDYEKELVKGLKEMGFASFDAYVKFLKQEQKNYYKTMFGVKITYDYEIKDNKMTLTEKFTGVKNMFNSECRFDNESGYGYIDYSYAGIRFREDDSEYSGDVNTDTKTISFESVDETVTATYTENISEETVTIKFKGKEYVCKFEADKYTQVE